uniref:Small ribosomal subunit protein uS10 domain-containing protein n=1 Tax=Haptolina ericina TaxID=156174 RepID=A0A7S3FAX5_9EUKA
MPKPPGSIRLAQVQLKAWHKVLLEEVADDILKTAKVMAVQTSGLIRLPTKISRWSLIRSPFVHKSHWDQFERREHGRLIELYGKGPTTEDGTRCVHFLRHLEFSILPAHAGARARIKLFSDEMLNPIRPETPPQLPQQAPAPPAPVEGWDELSVYGALPLWVPRRPEK